MAMNYQEVADILDELPSIVAHTRRRKGMSLRAVGRALGISDVTVAHVESGEYDVTLSTVKAILRWAQS